VQRGPVSPVRLLPVLQQLHHHAAGLLLLPAAGHGRGGHHDPAGDGGGAPEGEPALPAPGVTPTTSSYQGTS